LYTALCVSVCLSAKNSGTGTAMPPNFPDSSRAPRGWFLVQKLGGSWVGSQNVYTFVGGKED